MKIKDPNILWLVKKYLKAGVMEDGNYSRTEWGTIQGGNISPISANVYILLKRKKHGRDGFYLIDPNMGNVHDSPNLDYAKLLQSLHGNYEFLMATEQIMVKGNRIEFKFIKSDSYKFLLEKMDDYMAMAFSYEQVRSIYFHEVIHWIRLLPYKIKKDGKRALLFYAGLLIVLDDVVERYVE